MDTAALPNTTHCLTLHPFHARAFCEEIPRGVIWVPPQALLIAHDSRFVWHCCLSAFAFQRAHSTTNAQESIPSALTTVRRSVVTSQACVLLFVLPTATASHFYHDVIPTCHEGPTEEPMSLDAHNASPWLGDSLQARPGIGRLVQLLALRWCRDECISGNQNHPRPLSAELRQGFVCKSPDSVHLPPPRIAPARWPPVVK